MTEPVADIEGFNLQPEPFNKQFTVEQAIYPDDLMGEKSAYGNNMVVFYISTQNDTKLERDGGVNYVEGDPLKRAGTGSNLASIKTSKETDEIVIKGELGLKAGAAGAAAGEALRQFGNLFKPYTSRRNGSRVMAKIGTAGGALAALTSGLTRHQTRTIKQAIALYMPHNLSTTYSMGWETDSTLLGTAALEGLQSALDASYHSINTYDPVMGAATIAKNAEIAAGEVAAKFGSAITSKVLGSTGMASRLSATTGNPKKEQIFQGVDFRNFTFEYKFMPRSAAEAKRVQNIIRLFKLHQHPEFSPTEGNYLYLYPSEFDIRYYHREGPGGEWKENLNIHRHTSCVLSTMSVSYGNGGVYSSFSDGQPTEMNLSLQFKELAILTKENIQNGF